MSRISIPTLDDAPSASRPILDAVNAQLGVTPNLFRLVALSPAALAGMTGLSGALAKALDVKTRERLAIATAQVNGCDYCLSAHTYLGLNLARLSPEEIALNRQGASSDAKADAAVRFGAKVAQTRGKITTADLDAMLDLLAVAAYDQAVTADGQRLRWSIDGPGKTAGLTPAHIPTDPHAGWNIERFQIQRL